MGITTDTKTINEFYSYLEQKHIALCEQIEEAMAEMGANITNYEAHTQAYNRCTALQEERTKIDNAREALSDFRRTFYD